MPTKAVVSVSLIILITVAILGTITWFLTPTFAGPSIDGTWAIAYNEDDSWDCISASWVQKEYGGTLQDINEAHEWDSFSQNIFIIGGSRPLYIEAKWLTKTHPLYGITRPDTYPDVAWQRNDDTGKLEIVTPKRTYTCDSANDYGLIAKGYDYANHRWVIIAIGYSQYATGYASKLICTEYERVIGENSYIIFRCTAHSGVDVNEWSMDAFDGEIVEFGG